MVFDVSDRLQEIRARLDAATTTMPGANERMVWESGRMYRVEDDRDRASRALYHHAPADIAWLLRRLDFETRLVADLEAQLDRAHERYAAEVERLRNTKASPPNPLRDGGDDA